HIGIELNQEAISGLMDSSLDIDDLKEIYDLAEEVEGVIGVSYLRGRHVGEEMHVDLNVYVDKGLTVKEGDQIVRWIQERIRYKMEHIHDIRVSLTPAQVVKAQQGGKSYMDASGNAPFVTVN
ncbi:MAG: hypothetical protein HN344_07630, partial [Gammaproteobacteria bacterium]|nr:hypothetical protein [Gammaproteobacteria bacterium]